MGQVPLRLNWDLDCFELPLGEAKELHLFCIVTFVDWKYPY